MSSALNFGNLKVSAVAQSEDTNWVAYTPTLSAGFGTPTGVSVFWKRQGDRLLVKGSFTNGTTAASLGTISLPSGLAIDSAKVGVSNTDVQPGPGVGILTTTTTNQYAMLVTALGTQTDRVYLGNAINVANKLTPSNVDGVIASSVFTTFEFSVPISGWSVSGGSVVGPWERDDSVLVPVNFGTVTVIGFFKKRVGDELWIRGVFTSGTSTGNPARLTLDSAYTIDLAKTAPTTDLVWDVGEWGGLYNAGPQVYADNSAAGRFYVDGTNADRVHFSTSGASQAYGTVNASTVAASGNRVVIKEIRIPIVGW
jgi:hypothetical protein